MDEKIQVILEAKDLMSGEVRKVSSELSGMEKASRGLGVALGAVGAVGGAAVGLAAREVVGMGDAVAGLKARLGLTGAEATELGDVAQRVFRGNWGDSLAAASDAVTVVRQNLGEMPDAATEAATVSALALQQAFQVPVEFATRTVGIMKSNFDGLADSDAFDLITYGFQNIRGFAEDGVDTIREYAPQFAAMGFSAGEMLAIMEQGAASGAFNMDKVGDAIKELNIRAGDGTAARAMETLGFNATEMSRAIVGGGPAARDAATSIIAALASVEDPAEQRRLGFELMGAPFEDIGMLAVSSLATAGDAMDAAGGRADALADSLSSGPTSAWDAMTRSVSAFVIDALSPMQPALQAVAPLLAGIGPMLPMITTGLGGLIGSLAGATGASAAFAKIAPLVGTAMHAALGPIGLVTAAVGLLAAAFATDFLGIRSAVTDAVDDMALNFGTMGNQLHAMEATYDVSFQHVKDIVKASMEEMGLTYEQAVARADRILAGIPITANKHFEAFDEITHLHLLAAKGMVQTETGEMAAALGGMPEVAADQLLANQFHLTDAIGQLLDFSDQALAPAEEMFNARAFLASKEYAQALASNNPTIRAKAQEMAAEAEAVLKRTQGFYGGGRSAGIAWANGLRSAKHWANLVAWEVAASASPALHGLSPPKEGPLSKIDIGGLNVGTAWARGLLASARLARDSAHSLADEVAGNLAYAGGSGGFALAAAPVGVGGGGGVGGTLWGRAGGGLTINFNSTWPPTAAQAREVADIVSRQIGQQLRMTAGGGLD